jgi:glutathione S-transferase
MALTLYQSDISPTAARVRILAAAKGLSLHHVPVPPLGATEPEHLAMNPLGTVPWLDIGNMVILDAEVICEYLEDAYPTPTLRALDPATRAKARLIARIVDLYIPPALLKLHLQLDPATRDPLMVDKGHEELATALGYIAHYLEGPDYAVGGQLSQADCALVPHLFFIENLVPFAYGRPSLITGKLKTYHDNIVKDSYVALVVAEMSAESRTISSQSSLS